MTTSSHVRMLKKQRILSIKKKCQRKPDFPTSSVQPTPFMFATENDREEKIIYGYIRDIKIKLNNLNINHTSIINMIKYFYVTDLQMIYSTRYETDNPDITGIIAYNLDTGKHEAIELWCNSTYFPRWNVTIFNKYKDIIIFVGGSNVNKNNQEYGLIAFYDMKTQNISTIDVDYVIGSNAKAVLTNENSLHIIGGQLNDKHILFNLETKQSSIIYDFGDTNPGIQEHGLIYDPVRHNLMLFGGYHLAKYEYYDDFYILNLKNKICTLSMIECATHLVNGYMTKTFSLRNKLRYDYYDISLNRLITCFVGYTNVVSQWKRIDKFTMINGIRSFGTIFYDYRIIVVFGGIEAHNLIDTIYYLNIGDDDNGWKISALKCPRRGMCNTVLVGNEVHILPYYAYTRHYVVDIKHILPNKLLK